MAIAIAAAPSAKSRVPGSLSPCSIFIQMMKRVSHRASRRCPLSTCCVDCQTTLSQLVSVQRSKQCSHKARPRCFEVVEPGSSQQGQQEASFRRAAVALTG